MKKGDALTNKTYVVGCISKKVKRNDGERAQYYVENNHPAIISSEKFNRVQEEMAGRSSMVREHNNHSDQKEFFMKGYNEMLRRIEPSKIICYSEPFPEMQGDIIYIDYELSGWKYLNSKSACLSLHKNDGIIVHKTMVQPDDLSETLWKGSESAYGGKWKPKKEDDERFLGKPGEIKETYDSNGEKRLTKIGGDILRDVIA